MINKQPLRFIDALSQLSKLPGMNISVKPATLRQPARLLRPVEHRFGIDANVFTHIGSRPRANAATLVANSGLNFDATAFRDGSSWKIRMNEGYVRCVETGTDLAPVVSYTEVTDLAGGDAEFSVSDGSKVYVEVQTNGRGKPTAASILIASSDPESNPYSPDVGEGDSNGTYYFKILEVDISGDTISLKKFIVGDLLMPNVLWATSSEGEGAGIIKSFDGEAGKYEFRKLKAKNESPASVELSGDNNSVEIGGNDFDADISDAVKVTASCKDGYVTVLSESGAAGYSGEVLMTFSYTAAAATTTTVGLRLLFEDGVLQEVYEMDTSGEFILVEDGMANIAFDVVDTNT